MKFGTVFHPKTDGQAEYTIQTLIDLLRACVIEFKGTRDENLPLIEFSYNNSYHSTISMSPFEVFYWRRCKSPVGYYEVAEFSSLGPNMVYESLEKVLVIRDRLKVSRSQQKSYADNRKRDLEFYVVD